MRSEIWQILRRIKPEKHLVSLKPRDTSQLPFLDRTQQIPSNLLYDTTVYIDILQRRFPYEPQVTLRAAGTWHSPATEAELILLCGFLNPTHPKTRNAVQEIISTLDQRRAHRTIVPDREVWMEASVLSGLLARLQKYSSTDRRRALFDALLFATARKHGLTVLTRNRTDFDFLQQLAPSGRVLFYERI